MDVINISSGSEDEAEAVPPTPANLPASPTKSTTTKPKSTSMLATSNMVPRRPGKKKRRIILGDHFPLIKDVNTQLRAAFGLNLSQSKIMKIVQFYISELRVLQYEVQKYPNKCRLLSRSISQTLLLLRGLAKHFADEPYYLQKLCELLAIYTFLELRFASAFTDSKISIAERIVTNIQLHLGNVDLAYTLRIFSYIPYVGKEAEIMTKIFQRIFPEQIIIYKHEFNDRLYIQYLIAFYHWKESELLYEDQQKVITLANKFMKPMHSLKSNAIYARHLPSYVKRDDATSYFLSNMVFFNDLRNASLLDGIAERVFDLIDLSDEMESLSIDYAEIKDEQMIAPVANVKLEERKVVATVDLTDVDDDAPWLKRLQRKAIELEVKLPRIMTQEDVPNLDVIDLDSSDEDSWAFDDVAPRSKKNEKYTQSLNADVNSYDSYQNLYNELNMAVDIPDGASADTLLKELTLHIESRIMNSDETTQDQVNYSKAERFTFRGIIDKEIYKMPTSSMTRVRKSHPKNTINKANLNTDSNSFDAMDLNIKTNDIPKTIVSTEETVTSKDKPAVAANAVAVKNVMRDSEMPTTSSTNNLSNGVGEKSYEKPSEKSSVTTASTTTTTTNTISRNKNTDNNEVEEEIVMFDIDAIPTSCDLKEKTDETFPKDHHMAPSKTYTRKGSKKSDTSNTADEEEFLFGSNSPNDKQQDKTETTNQKEANKNAPNVLFSGKVVSLREEGDATPSYLKVPESVEVSSEGSNVVFSMQGRRLSSFPPLEVSSSNEQGMPDFDTDDSEFSEEEQEDEEDEQKEEEEEEDQSFTTKTRGRTREKSVPKEVSSLVSGKAKETERPKRRQVCFSDKPEIHEISPREPITSSESLSIASTINRLKQQYLPSTTSPSTSAHTNTIAARTSATVSNFFKCISPNRPATSPEIAALKTAQEQDLVQRLFPDLFVGVKVPQQNQETDTETESNTPDTSEDSLRHEPSTSRAAIANLKTATKSNPSSARKTNRDRRRKNSTPVPVKPSCFDIYLKNLFKKNSKKKSQEESGSSSPSSRPTSRAGSMTSFDIASDAKLSEMRAVVIAERLPEPIFRAEYEKLQKAISVNNNRATTSAKAIAKSPYAEFTQRSPMVVLSMPKNVILKAETTNLLACETEQEINTESRVNSSTLAEETTLEFENAVDQDTGETCRRLVKKSHINADKQLEEIMRELEKETEINSQETNHKPYYEEDPSETDVKKIKMEELDPESSVTPDVNLTESLKKSTKTNKSRSVKKSRSTSKHRSKERTLLPEHKSTSIVDNSYETPADRWQQEPPTSLPNTSKLDLSLRNPSQSQENTSQTPPEHNISQSCSPKRQVKVLLKRFNFNDGEQYIIVSNTALDDLHQDLHSKEIQINKTPNHPVTDDVPEKEKKISQIEKKRRLKERKEKKGPALKKLFRKPSKSGHSNVVALENRNFHRQLLAKENNEILFRAVGHNIESISTPPPTPPSPLSSLSPATADDSSQDGGLHTDSIQPKDESNNNYVQSLSPLHDHNEDITLSSYFLSCPDKVSDFFKHENLPPDVPIDTKLLIQFYNYLVERNDADALEEICKIKPLLNSRVNDLLPPAVHTIRRKSSNSFETLSHQRCRKYSSDVGYERSSWSIISNKRRRTICSDSPYHAESSDIHVDNANWPLSGETETAADCQTVEVLRLQRNKYDIKSKPCTVVSSNVVEKIDTSSVEVESSARSGQIPLSFLDGLSLSPSPVVFSNTLAPVQSECHMENECECEREQGTSTPTPTKRTICESPPDICRNMVVSRTYSKDNMVQHVFVPPEIERCIEEQASTATTTTTITTADVNDPINNLPSTSKRQGKKNTGNSGVKSRKGKKKRKVFVFSDDDSNIDNDTNTNTKNTDDDNFFNSIIENNNSDDDDNGNNNDNVNGNVKEEENKPKKVKKNKGGAIFSLKLGRNNTKLSDRKNI